MIAPVAVGVLGYVAAQLVLGMLVARARRVRDEADFLLAGRSLGYGLAIFTIFATWFGAETCLGAAGAVYADGLSGGRADPFGYALCLLLMAIVFAVPLRRSGALTLGDVFRSRFSPGSESLVVLFLVPASVLWAAAQIRALGQVLAALGQIDPTLTTAAAALVVVIYTSFGGMRADVITDLFQGVALMIGLGVLMVVVTGAAGGAAVVADTWGQALAREARPSESPWSMLESWLIPIVGSVTAQELAARVLSCRTPTVARRATFIASGLYVAVGLIPVSLGLLAARMLPGIPDAEGVLPALAARYLEPVGQILLLGALVSAILSTVDSNLLATAALVQHNVLARLWPGRAERTRLVATQLLVVATGIVAWALAVSRDSVYALVEEASAFGGGGMAVAMAFGLLGKFGGPRAALGAMSVSLAVQTLGTYVWKLEAPMAVSCGASLLVFLAIGGGEALRGRAAPMSPAGA